MTEIVYSGFIEGSLRASRLVRKNSHICTVDLMLDVGFLSPSYNSEYRRKLYNVMYDYQFPGVADMSVYFDRSIQSIRKMKRRAAAGETLRIWADADTRGRCNTALICSILTGIKGLGQVIIMDPPRMNYWDESVHVCSSWWDFDQSSFSAYLGGMRTASRRELNCYAAEWQRLVTENSSLRTLICNQVRSVPEDFYDEILLEYISEEPQYENIVTGNFMAETRYRVDWLFLSRRIVELIRQGRIELVEEWKDEHGQIKRIIRKA